MHKAKQAYHQQQTTSSRSPLEAYLPFVRKIALQIYGRMPPNVQLEDLIQAGCEGLLQCAQRFDPTEHKASFETYSALRIKGAILDFLREQDLLPKKERTFLKKIEQAVDHLRQTLGKEPSEELIAQYLKIPLDQLQDSLFLGVGQFISIEDLGLEDAGALFDSEQSGALNPIHQLMEKQQIQLLLDQIDALPQSEKQVLALYYDEEFTFKEIAHILSLSEARISQIHSQALNRIKKHIASKNSSRLDS